MIIHNNVNLSDGNGNSVKIGYFKNIKEHASLYKASEVDFEPGLGENTHRISIRAEGRNGGTGQAIIYMYFKGKNKSYYNKIVKMINAYKPYVVKKIPYKKQ